MPQFLDPNYKKINKSATTSIFENYNPEKNINLGFGQSPFPSPNFLLENLKKNIDKNKYLTTQGILPLRKEIANYYSSRDNIEISPDQVIIGNGSKNLIYLLFMVIKARIFITKPCWVSYVDQLKILKKKYHVINTRYLDNYQINQDHLGKSVLKYQDDTKLLVFNNPHNPTGAYYNNQDIENLSKVLKSDNIFILADEIYSELVFREKYTSFAQYLPDQTIIVSSISKFLGSGGWRLGFMILPKPLLELLPTIMSIISQTYTNVSSPLQYACVGMYTNPEMRVYVDKCKLILEKLSAYCVRLLKKSKIRFISPKSSWYIYLDFSLLIRQLNNHDIHDAKQLQSKIASLGVLTLACDYFGTLKGDIALRCCLVDFDGELALKNFHSQLNDLWIETHCQRVIKAIGIISCYAISIDSD